LNALREEAGTQEESRHRSRGIPLPRDGMEIMKSGQEPEQDKGQQYKDSHYEIDNPEMAARSRFFFFSSMPVHVIKFCRNRLYIGKLCLVFNNSRIAPNFSTVRSEVNTFPWMSQSLKSRQIAPGTLFN